MTGEEKLFLRLYRAGMLGEKPELAEELSSVDWTALLRLAHEQDLLPLIYQEAYRLPGFSIPDPELKKRFQARALEKALRQVRQTNEFLTLLLHAEEKGMRPVVLKGIVCRSLYPKPMLRPSVDEDILIPPEEVRRWHDFLLAEGLFADEPEADLETADELSYHRAHSPTYIELHKSLFPASSAAYGDYNELFAGCFARTIELQVEDVTLRTLSPTDHVLYLLCHACKHFLHSGVGVRQMGDIAEFIQAYGDAIDWEWVLERCREKKIEVFAAAVLQICREHLTLKEMPGPFAGIEADGAGLLEDALSGGLYGAEDEDRVHSSNLTLEAVAAGKQGRSERGIWKSLFPGKAYLQSRYAYAARHAWLLPAAWAQRIWQYLTGNTRAARSLQIGRERIALLRQYKIIP